MEAKATLKFARISPRKVEIVCSLIRGKKTDYAMALMENTPKAACELMTKLLKSACANAENNFEMDPDNLFVKEAYVTPGPILKRMRFVSRAGVHRVNKRTDRKSVV